MLVLSCPDKLWPALSCPDRHCSLLDTSWPIQTCHDLSWSVLAYPDLSWHVPLWTVLICSDLSVVGSSGLYQGSKNWMSVCSKRDLIFTSKPGMKEHLENKHTKIINTNVSLSVLDLIVLPSTRFSSLILIIWNNYKLILVMSLVNLKLAIRVKSSSTNTASMVQID